MRRLGAAYDPPMPARSQRRPARGHDREERVHAATLVAIGLHGLHGLTAVTRRRAAETAAALAPELVAPSRALAPVA